MNLFAKKITSLTYIWLILSAPAINAARVKQQYDAYDAARTTLDARQDSRQSQELRQEMVEAMQEIDQINSEHLSANMGQTSYWGESWATCDDELEDFLRRQKKMEARYENGMKDGDMSAMESGRVSLKAFSVASTLSKASKKGCDWVTNKSVDSSSMNRILAKTMKEQKCLGAAKEFLEKAHAAGESPDEAKVKAQKIMLSMDCKVPSEDKAAAQKSFQQLARMEEAAEAGALSEIQEFRRSLDAGKQTALVESDSSAVVLAPIAVLVYFFTVWLAYALTCTVIYSVLATLLSMVFLALKAAFKFALGYTSGGDFQAELGQIMKPFFTIIATGCSAYSALFSGIFVILIGGGELALWLGTLGVAGSLGTGVASLANQAFGPANSTKAEGVEAPPKKEGVDFVH
jgi:hypothetical protein